VPRSIYLTTDGATVALHSFRPESEPKATSMIIVSFIPSSLPVPLLLVAF
jgi:hypothetical protein